MRGAFFLAMVLLALVPTGMVGCASVEGLIVEDRLGDACRLSKDDGGFFRDHDTEVALLRDAVQSRITVNVVAPGFIETDMTSVLNEEVRKGALSQIPVARFGATDDIAAAVSFLASAEASYISGQVLAVDGGMSM